MAHSLRSSRVGEIIEVEPDRKHGGIDIKLNGKVIANFLEEDIYDFALDTIESCIRKEIDLLGPGLRRRKLEVQFARAASNVICQQHLV